MRLLKGSIAAIVLTIGLVASTQAPASADYIGGGVAVVRITTTAGLGFYDPTRPGNGGTPGGFGAWFTGPCAGGIANVLKKALPADVFTSCHITANGVFSNPGTTLPLGLEPSGGTCGRSSGTVTGTLSYNSATNGFQIYDYSGSFQTAGSAVVITGSIGKRNSPPQPISLFTFVGDAIPDPSAGTSCVTTRNQREFIVVGIFGVIAVSV
jgi:hypothetical protein